MKITAITKAFFTALQSDLYAVLSKGFYGHQMEVNNLTLDTFEYKDMSGLQIVLPVVVYTTKQHSKNKLILFHKSRFYGVVDCKGQEYVCRVEDTNIIQKIEEVLCDYSIVKESNFIISIKYERIHQQEV